MGFCPPFLKIHSVSNRCQRCLRWSTTGVILLSSTGSPRRTATYSDFIGSHMVFICNIHPIYAFFFIILKNWAFFLFTILSLHVHNYSLSSFSSLSAWPGRGGTSSTRPVVYLQHCLTCSSAIWVFGRLTLPTSIYRPEYSDDWKYQDPLKNLWLSFWRTLATMCGWATAEGTLIQGGQANASLEAKKERNIFFGHHTPVFSLNILRGSSYCEIEIWGHALIHFSYFIYPSRSPSDCCASEVSKLSPLMHESHLYKNHTTVIAVEITRNTKYH